MSRINKDTCIPNRKQVFASFDSFAFDKGMHLYEKGGSESKGECQQCKQQQCHV